MEKHSQNPIHELLEKRRQHKEELAQLDRHISERLEEAFESMWQGKIKPLLESLHHVASDLVHEFRDHEEEFRLYVRLKEPDVDIELLEEIAHRPKLARSQNKKKRKVLTADEKRKHLSAYEDLPQGTGQRENYLIKHELSYGNISSWRKAKNQGKLA